MSSEEAVLHANSTECVSELNQVAQNVAVSLISSHEIIRESILQFLGNIGFPTETHFDSIANFDSRRLSRDTVVVVSIESVRNLRPIEIESSGLGGMNHALFCDSYQLQRLSSTLLRLFSNFISMESSIVRFKKAIRTIASGYDYEDPNLTRELKPLLSSWDGILTKRQFEVVQLIAQGLTSKRIAQEMGIAPKTVENHRHKIFRNLDVSNKSQLLDIARERSWI